MKKLIARLKKCEMVLVTNGHEMRQVAPGQAISLVRAMWASDPDDCAARIFFTRFTAIIG
jgi:hypothetical protein